MTDSLLQQGKNAEWNLREELRAALVATPDIAVEYDAASSTVGYLGKAVLGTASSAPNWQIKKFVFTASGGVSVQHADGDSNFDNIWDNRVSLSYS